MFTSTNEPTILKVAVTATFIAALAIAPLAVAQQHEPGKQDLTAAAEKSVTGEVVDLMCYIDHGATGDKHSACGSKCIKGGGPVGIVENGKAYLVVGEHKPINDELAESCGKTVTIKGKVAERGGMVMLENAEVVKK
ncbi:MAG TPA: hypothetical protein VIW21_09090 [Chthoniobacterales bacterium]|jgi:hypothetical protein